MSRYEFRYEHKSSYKTSPHGHWWIIRNDGNLTKRLPIRVSLVPKGKDATYIPFQKRRPRPSEITLAVICHRSTALSKEQRRSLAMSLKPYDSRLRRLWRHDSRRRIQIRNKRVIDMLDAISDEWIPSPRVQNFLSQYAIVCFEEPIASLVINGEAWETDDDGSTWRPKQEGTCPKS